MPVPHRAKTIASKLLEFPQDLAVDLAAFSEAHYGAPVARIIREAIREFIDSKLKAEPQMRQRFLDARVAITRQPSEKIRLLSSTTKPR